MRRYPIGSSTDENQSNQHYYVASSQQISPKKTWTQRLKITKSEKSINSPSSIKDISSEFTAGSIALRSMKYAEPWLYGTVRGIPARPAHGQPIFAPIPTEVAVVVCSCPEYLSGTKKEIKKASICKKCKGSRLPLAPIGGTVRIASTTAPIIHKSRSSAGTMRLPSTSSSKLRPSILDPQNDPYDLMRRTRLLSPEPKLSTKSSDKSIRNRAKSTSPSRGRSRSRLKPAPPPPAPPKVDEIVPLKSSKSKILSSNKQDCWLDTLEPDPGGRRSILHCNVNPYDLISSSSTHMNEFSPHNDEDDDLFGSSHHLKGTVSRASGKTVNYSNIKAIAGQRIILGDENVKSTSSLITQNGDKFICDGISLKKSSSESTNKVDNEKLKPQQSPPSQQQQQQQNQQKQQQQQPQSHSQIRRSQQNQNVNEKTNKKLDNLMDTKQQPKRPPRRKHETSSVNEDNEVPSISSTKLTNENSGSSESHSSSSGSLPLSSPLSSLQLQISSDPVTSQKQAVIKSILKRPSSLSSSVSIDKDAKNCVTDSNTTYNDSLRNFNSDKTSTMSTNSGNETKCNDKANGSQFYLPLPTTTTTTRKKVQFMVEDKIILDEYDENPSIIEVNKNSGVKMTSPPPPPPSTMKGKERQSFHQHEKQQQQNKQQEIFESLQKESKPNTYGSIRMYKDDSDKGKGNHGVVESLPDVMVNGKAVSPPSQSSPLASLSTEIMKSNVVPSDENCVVVIKQEKSIVDKENISEDGGVISAECNEEDDTLTDSSTPKKLRSLRRTHSDRRSNNTTTITLNFNDTMALRAKQIRSDSRDLFSEDVQQQSQQQHQQQQQQRQNDDNRNTEESEHKKFHNHQQRSILKQKNKYPVEIQTMVSEKVAQIKIINNDEIISNEIISNENELQKEFICKKDEKEQQQREVEEKPQTQNVLKFEQQQQQRLEQQQHQQQDQKFSNKKISWQENGGIVMIKNDDSNTFLEWNGKSDVQNDENSSGFTEKNNTSTITDGNSIRKINRTSNATINCQQNLSIHQPPQVEERNTMVDGNRIDNARNNAVKLKEKDKDKLLQAQNEIYNGARLFGNQNKSSNTQKTVVRVAPFNKTSSEIHRLKIQHQDDSNTDDNVISQKKTSIFINGDDCYSTVNVSSDTPIYQSSVVVTDVPKNSVSSSASASTAALVLSSQSMENLGMRTTPANTVTISVCSSSKNRTPEEEIIYKNNKINTLLSQNVTKSVIPISNQEDSGSLMTTSTQTTTTTLKNDSNNSNLGKRVKTLITLGPGDKNEGKNNRAYDDNGNGNGNGGNVFSHEEELVKILRNPVEAVKRNLVPHVCGKSEGVERGSIKNQSLSDTMSLKQDNSSFIGKLLQDSTLSQLAEGLDNDVVIKLIEKSLKRLKDSRNSVDTSGTKDTDDMTKLIDTCLQKIKDEKHKLETLTTKSSEEIVAEEQESQSNRGSISSGNSYSSANYELFEFENNESDCYQSCSSEITGDDDTNPTRNKFYQMLVDATLSEIEISTNIEDDHHYESIRLNGDPIYEEISEIPPPLPLSPPPISDPELDKKNARSMFEGASKYDILSYLVDAKERGIVREESYEYNFSNTSDIIVEEEIDTLSDLNKKQVIDASNRISHLSITSDSSEETSLTSSFSEKTASTTSTTAITTSNQHRKPTSDIERNDSGVGSETSKSSRSKYQSSTGGCVLDKNSPIHLCEDCDGPVETQITDSGVMYAPLVCRKCGKKRAERKEIITEIVETEEKYGRDLQIILEEFCQPMLVAGLLTQEQLSAIFLNTEELLENNQALAEKMRDALDIALEQGDDDLLTVNIGKIFLECTPMLHAFETYCVRQAAASLLLANLEKEKELLRIFLKVSQMENTVLRRMNLNSFLMVPVQRVTKYPLLLARLYKVTPPHLEGREMLKQAQEKIELHLNHMNQEAKDVPTKLWRRISSSSPNRRASCEIDMINIKLRKMAIDVLEWNHDEVRFAMEGKLLFTQPTDNNWKKGRTIKLTPVNALLVTNGKPSANYKAEKALSEQLNFPKHTGIREAALLLVKEKCGRYTLIREPLYLDRCVICTEADWDDYFEVHEISSKDTFIFKAEDGVRSKQWYIQLQYHAQGMGAWRKRRNALANIMINGMLSRT